MSFPDYQNLPCQPRKQLSSCAEKLLELVFPFPKYDYKPLKGPITVPSIILIRPCASQCQSYRRREMVFHLSCVTKKLMSLKLFQISEGIN